MKNAFLAMVLLTLSPMAFANTLNLHCYNTETPATCALKVEVALEKLGCEVNVSANQCDYALVEDPNNQDQPIPGDTPYCAVESVNCSQPRVGLFGAEDCIDSRKTAIAKSDKVHNGYWFGPFGSYSRTICIK